MLRGRDRGPVRLDNALPAPRHRRHDPHRPAHGHRDVQVDRRATMRIGRGESLPQTGGELGIVGLPDGLPWLHRVEVDRAVPKRQLHLTTRHRLGQRVAALKHLVDAAPLRVVDRLAAVEGHAVAPFHAGHEIDHHPAPADSRDGAELHASLRAARRRHEHFMIAALEPAR